MHLRSKIIKGFKGKKMKRFLKIFSWASLFPNSNIPKDNACTEYQIFGANFHGKLEL